MLDSANYETPAISTTTLTVTTTVTTTVSSTAGVSPHAVGGIVGGIVGGFLLLFALLFFYFTRRLTPIAPDLQDAQQMQTAGTYKSDPVADIGAQGGRLGNQE